MFISIDIKGADLNKRLYVLEGIFNLSFVAIG